MQQTRQYILETLHEHGEATVDELVNALRVRINHDITAVTVRHHLDILRSEELVTAPAVRRRHTPGRPQYVYALTEKALDTFPNNYQNLTAALLNQIKATLPTPQVNTIMERVADELIAKAPLLNGALEARLESVIKYLSQHGYEASWEPCPDGYLLRMYNCPYRSISGGHEELCGMDFRLVSGLVGIVPRRLARIAAKDENCVYLIPTASDSRKT
jgi:DeoR family suf operon transcriptional repressor